MNQIRSIWVPISLTHQDRWVIVGEQEIKVGYSYWSMFDVLSSVVKYCLKYTNITTQITRITLPKALLLHRKAYHYLLTMSISLLIHYFPSSIKLRLQMKRAFMKVHPQTKTKIMQNFLNIIIDIIGHALLSWEIWASKYNKLKDRLWKYFRLYIAAI